MNMCYSKFNFQDMDHFFRVRKDGLLSRLRIYTRKLCTVHLQNNINSLGRQMQIYNNSSIDILYVYITEEAVDLHQICYLKF